MKTRSFMNYVNLLSECSLRRLLSCLELRSGGSENSISTTREMAASWKLRSDHALQPERLTSLLLKASIFTERTSRRERRGSFHQTCCELFIIPLVTVR